MKRSQNQSRSRRRGDGELFSMSFLDVICCGFGAMLLLVLLSKSDVVGGAVNIDAVKNLLASLSAEKKRNAENEAAHAQLLAQTRRLEAHIKEAGVSEARHTDIQQRLATLRAQAQALKTQVDALKRHNARARDRELTKVVEVGGIPVGDSEYVIFIVDTSGSMQNLWGRVMDELENVLDIHPQVKGFQIMNDNGVYLISAYAGKWMFDTPRRRKSVLATMQNWTSLSNSSPVKGLETALKTYAKRTKNLAIYVFGDDYSGGSYDAVLDPLDQLNRNPITGKPIARIHAIGFLHAVHATDRFATLMREVTHRNRGAFVGLKLN